MAKFLTIHNETGVDRVVLESRWTEISQDPRADWHMTLYNLDLGRRYCEWDAPNREVIERIFRELGIKWTDIFEVEVTIGSQWRIWKTVSGKSH